MITPKNSTAESVARRPDPRQTAAGKQTATVRYVDLPECSETFADAVNGVFFDGQSLRIEFGITRMDEMKKDAPLTGRRYPACRLVLPPAAAIELINRMQQTAAALEQAGIVKANRKDGPAAP
jgi:hypothetical protein